MCNFYKQKFLQLLSKKKLIVFTKKRICAMQQKDYPIVTAAYSTHRMQKIIILTLAYFK